MNAQRGKNISYAVTILRHGAFSVRDLLSECGGGTVPAFRVPGVDFINVCANPSRPLGGAMEYTGDLREQSLAELQKQVNQEQDFENLLALVSRIQMLIKNQGTLNAG